MEERQLDVTIISAEDLKQVKWTGKMSPYAVAWVYPTHKASIRVDQEGGRNPKWNQKLQLSAAEHDFHSSNTFLTIDILHSCGSGKKHIGSVKIPLQELLSKDSKPEVQQMSQQVRRPSGRAQGVLKIAVSVGEKREVAAPPLPPQAHAAAFPVAGFPAQAPYYPPQQQQYPPQYGAYPPPNYYAAPPGGYPYPPPPQGYAPQGYPPPQGYGYPPRQPSRFGGGAGLGLGIGAGLLGGLLLGEALDDDSGGGDYGDGGGDF